MEEIVALAPIVHNLSLPDCKNASFIFDVYIIKKSKNLQCLEGEGGQSQCNHILLTFKHSLGFENVILKACPKEIE